MKKVICGVLLFSAVLFCLEIILAPRVVIKDEAGNEVLSFTMHFWDTFSTSYIHSVQLCLVTDIYCVRNGRLWLLEEQTGSTGAGLPSEAPQGGQFIHDSKHGLYRYIGGGRNFPEILLRVGTEQIGRNTLKLPRRNHEIELFRLFPDELLSITVERKRCCALNF